MIRFLHAADLHLDSPLVGLAAHPDAPLARLRAATRRAMDNLVDLAVAEEVAFVLLAGDLYDGSWRDYQTGLYFVRQMARLGQRGIRVFLAAGNHDAQSQLTRSLRLPANVHVFPADAPGTAVLEDLGVAIHGQGFEGRVTDRNLARGFPPARRGLLNVGLLHTSLTGRPGHDVYAPCRVEDLANRGYGYWALGHVHAFEIVARDPWVVFSGCLQGRHVREAGPKGVVLVTVEGGAVADVVFRPLDVLRWALCEVDVGGARDAAEAVERARQGLAAALGEVDGRPVAARVLLRGATAAHGELHGNPEKWTEEVRAAALAVHPEDLWVERVAMDTRPEAEGPGGEGASEAGGALIEAVRAVPAEALDACLRDLGALRAKLPAELFEGEGAVPDPTRLDEFREEAEALIVARLRSAGEG